MLIQGYEHGTRIMTTRRFEAKLRQSTGWNFEAKHVILPDVVQ